MRSPGPSTDRSTDTPSASKAKAIALRNSRPMVWHLPPESGAVVAAAAAVFELLKECPAGYQNRSIPKPRKVLGVIAVILMNLLRARFNDPRRYVAVGLAANDYTGNRHVSVRIVARTLEGLVALGLIDPIHRGFSSTEPGKGRRTRIRATRMLATLALTAGVQPHMLFCEPGQLVVLRAKKRTGDRVARNAPWPAKHRDSKRQYERSLSAINGAIDTWFIGLRVTDRVLGQIHERLNRSPEHQLDFFDRRLYRVFNDRSVERGGRFYGGWWQQVPREFRKHIHMASPWACAVTKYTVELDFRHMQPQLLYAQRGLVLDGDAYDLSRQGIPANDETRDIIKRVLLVMLNIQAPSGLPSAIRKQLVAEAIQDGINPNEAKHYGLEKLLPPGCPPVNQIAQALLAKHNQVQEHFYTGAGKALMFQESQIAERVMLRIIEGGGLALPIHDSFLVQKGYSEYLREIMMEEFEKATGQTCKLKADESEPEFEHRQKSPGEQEQFLTIESYQEELRREEVFEASAHTFYAMFNDWFTTYGSKESRRPELAEGLTWEVEDTSPFGDSA
jgi:hypothetical protein